MTENTTPKAHERKIAQAQAARQRVDSPGRRIGKAKLFHYDENGILSSVENAEGDD